MRFIFSTCLGLLVLATPSFSALADEPQQKRIVADFEDVGTWRAVDAHGIVPTAWFAAGVNLCGSTSEVRHDRYVGELKFAFDAAVPGPWSVAFRRQKVSLVSGVLDGIEFEADAGKLPVVLRFILEDSTGKTFVTTPVPLADGWKSYRVDLNEQTVPHLADCKFPAHLDRIVLEAAHACAGSIFLDDIALTGQFAPKDQLSIFPVADGIAYTPGSPVLLHYRLRNARSIPVAVQTHVEVQDFAGKTVFGSQRRDTVPAFGEMLADFPVPPLPGGPYSAEVIADEGGVQAAYDDCFAVFVPNGKRLNHRPMWFGITDQSVWHGEAENALHLAWMKALGIDLNRIEGSAGRFEVSPGVFAFETWKPMLDAFQSAGINLLLLYVGTPVWTQTGKLDPLGPPTDEAAYGKHITNVANFLKQYSVVKYLEFWNEPDTGSTPDSSFFHGDLDGYLRAFALFSKTVRAAAPGIRITNGGLTVFHPRERPGFSQGTIQRGAPFYDVAVFHAHGPVSNYQERESAVEQWMHQAGIDKPIGNTETGERSGYNPAGRAAQAVTLVKKIVYAKSRPSSEFYFWYTLQDYWDMDPHSDDSFGLVTSDNRPKPSFLAYNALIRELADATPEAAPAFDNRIEAYAFRRPDGSRVYVCWPKAGLSGVAAWLKDAPGTRGFNMFGAPLVFASWGGLTPVYFGAEPVYLETSPGAAALAAVPAGFIDFDDALDVTAGKPPRLHIRLRDPGAAKLDAEVSIVDTDGKPLWAQHVGLAPGGQSAIDAALPNGTDQAARTLMVGVAGQPRPWRFPLHLLAPYTIRRAPGNPLSADLANFVRQLPTLKLDRREDVFELAFDPAIPPWRGPDDLSVVARACHDGNGIYFRFDVTDDKQVQNGPVSQLWLGDSIQLALAAPGQRNYTIATLGLLPQETVAWCDAPPGQQTGRWDVPLRITRTGTVTAYEVYIPLTKIGLTPSTAPQPIRFSFLANENDGQGRVRWMHWHDGVGKGRDFDLLGYGTLEGKP